MSNIYPDSEHVRLVGLTQEQDFEVWKFARQNNFITEIEAVFGEGM